MTGVHPVDLLVADLARARERLLALVTPLDQAACDRRPGPGRWSPGEVLDHLAQSEAGAVKVIGHLLKRSADAPSDEALDDQRARLDFAGVRDRSRRMAVPDIVVPRPGRPRDDLLRDLAASRVGLLDLARRMHGRDLRGLRFPHALFGPLDPYQWLVFVAQHEARHAAQIEEAR